MEWLDPPRRTQPTPADLPAAILTELGRSRDEIADPRKLPAGIGHNNPPADDDGFVPVELVRELEAEIQTPHPDAAAIKGKWLAVAGWVEAVAKPLTDGVLERTGGELWLPAHEALLVWETAHHAGGLIHASTAMIWCRPGAPASGNATMQFRPVAAMLVRFPPDWGRRMRA